MNFMSLLTWFLSTATLFGGYHPSVAGGGPIAHPKTTAVVSGIRIDVAGGGPVAKK
jgi:hypothetical protein